MAWELADSSRVWYYPKKAECKAAPASSRARAGYVVELAKNSAIMRGMNLGKNKRRMKNDKSHHYLAPRATLPDGCSHSDLTLESVTATSRSLVLDLGQANFQFQFLTHTNIQFYTPENWEAVRETPHFKYGTDSEQRSRSCFLGTISSLMDGCRAHRQSQPTWISAADAKAGRLNHTDTLDMVQDFDSYLEHVMQWLTDYTDLSDAAKNVSIYNFMRDKSIIFSGVGMYSRTEILICSGVPPEMTLHEVVENRRRFYRIILSTCKFKGLVDKLWVEFVKPVIRNDMISPTVDERTGFTATLVSFARDVVKAPVRFRQAVERYNQELSNENDVSVETDESKSTDAASASGSDSESDSDEIVQEVVEESDASLSDIISYDPVEPMFFIDSLRLAPEFGPGIFGKDYWALHRHELGTTSVREHNPVVETDILNGSASSVSWLHTSDSSLGTFFSGVYFIDTSLLDTLVLDKSDMKAAHIPNGLYNFTDKDKLWTPLVVISGWPRKNIEDFFFKIIVRTKNIVVVGILEFAGNAIAIRVPGSRKRNRCYAIPSRGTIPGGNYISFYLAERAALSTICRIDAEKAEGTAKAGLKTDAREARLSARRAFREMWVDRFGSLPATAGELEPSEPSSFAPASPPPETESEHASISHSSSPQSISHSSFLPPVEHTTRGRKRIRGDATVILAENNRLEDNAKRARTGLGIEMNRRVHPMDRYLDDLDE
ncbi:hypothetical protein PENSPDRAFT_672076 [Peniophora sp. CONT]|nr:hypothetical protein PENSPDRAFT_672076 [Peniophora sp. CONT]